MALLRKVIDQLAGVVRVHHQDVDEAEGAVEAAVVVGAVRGRHNSEGDQDLLQEGGVVDPGVAAGVVLEADHLNNA